IEIGSNRGLKAHLSDLERDFAIVEGPRLLVGQERPDRYRQRHRPTVRVSHDESRHAIFEGVRQVYEHRPHAFECLKSHRKLPSTARQGFAAETSSAAGRVFETTKRFSAAKNARDHCLAVKEIAKTLPQGGLFALRFSVETDGP